MTRQRTEHTQRVQLPAHVVDRVEKRLPRTEFDGPGDYIAYVVEEVLAQVEDDTDDAMDEDNREELEARLKSLGYLED